MSGIDWIHWILIACVVGPLLFAPYAWIRYDRPRDKARREAEERMWERERGA